MAAALASALVLLLTTLPMRCVGKCLCCRAGRGAEAEEGFCKWWSAKHAKVDALGREAVQGRASEEAQRLFIAYFLTHARLEDPLMWDLFRECSAFDATLHEPLLRANEVEEDEIREGLDLLAAQVQGGIVPRVPLRPTAAGLQQPAAAGGCSLGSNATTGFNANAGAWPSVWAKVSTHIAGEEQVLKGSGLLEACEAHLDRRWTEIMEATHQDAQILYEEFRRMDLGLVTILAFVREMVADWPAFPELRQRTALRMKQVRHRMPLMLETEAGADLLDQVSPAALAEYWRWVQLERAEGLELRLGEELALHMELLRRLLLARPAGALASLLVPAGLAALARVAAGVASRRRSSK